MTTETQRPARMHWMDVLRGTAVLLVVLFHAAALQSQGDTPRLILWINDAAAPYRMPALMVASGVLLSRSLEKPTGAYLVGKLRTLAWPWLLWTVVMLPLAGWGSATSVGWWLGGTHTWFLSALFLLYLAGLAARRASPWGLTAACLIAYRLVQLLPDGDPAVFAGEATWYGAFFFAGAALRDRVIAARFPRWVLPVAIVVAGVWALYSVKAGGVVRLPVVAAVASVAGVLVICLVAQRLPRVGPVRAVEWVGRNSIVIYLVHWPVHYVIWLSGVELTDWFGLAVRFGAALVVCLVAAWARPWTRWLYEWPARGRDRAVAVPASR